MGRNELQLNRVLKNSFIQPGQKGSGCQARKESASERNNHNRLLGAGWWQMGLFQQAVRM